jgi:hypothetical protein
VLGASSRNRSHTPVEHARRAAAARNRCSAPLSLLPDYRTSNPRMHSRLASDE